MKLNATVLSRILWGVIAMLIISAGTGSYYANQLLETAATDADHAAIDAKISAHDVAIVNQLKSELAKKRDIVDRAKQIIADSQHYSYQDQIINDINTYASLTGVNVTGYTFEDPNLTKNSKSKKTTKPAQTLPKGVNAITATIKLGEPVEYRNFLKFLKAIEQNLTKMQITGVNIAPDEENVNQIANPSVGLKVYVKG